MNTKLRPPFRRRHIRTIEKCVTFFVVLLVPFFVVDTARASFLPQLREDGKTIVVRASVLLTPEFAYVIKKNSESSVDKGVYAIGEDVHVQVRIVGGRNETLRQHRVALLITNVHQEEAFILSGETDVNGLAIFTFTTEESLLGTTIIQATDVTYTVPLVLLQKLQFMVQQTQSEDSKKQREKAIKMSMLGFHEQPFPAGQKFITERKIVFSALTTESNATIEKRNIFFTLARAGPGERSFQSGCEC